MDERRCALEGLHQVGFDGLFQNHRHCAGNLEVLGCHRRATCVVADDDAAHPGPQVGERRAQCQGGHDLGCGGDVKAGLTGHPVEPSAKSHDHVPERAFVDVEYASPGDAVWVEVQVVAMEQVGVEHGRAHVVGGCDGVHVTCQVQVEQLHGNDLAVATSGGSSLDAECRAHRRLPDGDRGLLVYV